MTLPNPPQIAIIGFGEAARAFVPGWQESGATRLATFDRKSENPATAPEIAAACAGFGVACHATRPAALVGAQAVVCLVTADQAEAAAQSCAPYLAQGALWLDGNSCSPEAKRRSAAAIAAAGGRYVDMAIMAPVHPQRHKVPVLLAGPDAKAAQALLDRLGMRAQLAGPGIGDASSIKMIRSIMIKGLEALGAECFLAARKAGVDEAVLASLSASDPGFDWARRGAYMLERMLVHGERRAAEMREVAATLRDLGLPDRMAAATVDWQAQLAALELDPGPDDLALRSDRILAHFG